MDAAAVYKRKFCEVKLTIGLSYINQFEPPLRLIQCAIVEITAYNGELRTEKNTWAYMIPHRLTGAIARSIFTHAVLQPNIRSWYSKGARAKVDSLFPYKMIYHPSHGVYA